MTIEASQAREARQLFEARSYRANLGGQPDDCICLSEPHLVYIFFIRPWDMLHNYYLIDIA